ncbi:lactate utilization protein C [Actinoallomurus spadix]|uniref:LUD domain-containing protein n=1 Tax=Actinoallomurus spadix TaxID=79912 RepID=A0ABN0W0F1_9ACTN|nr:lactate utilization protein C [Actinoallomurus spadix]MCO5988202.1 lactate utilization protein C [Actinoallomurus spadix]
MNAREEILRRLGETPAEPAAYAAIPRPYLRRHHEGDAVELFAERAADYRAEVRRIPGADLPAVLGALRGHYVVPDGLPADWTAGADVVRDDPPVSIAALDALDGVITGCAVAIAETGTVVLDHGPGQGRRALTLVPDHHVVVVESARIAADVPEALERLSPDRPLTFISGPSATSDIELSRVEGVHGPRRLTIVITD